VTSTGDEAVFQPLQADDPAAAGPYRLAARLGSGGMGKVYLSHTPAGRPVAVKVIRPEFAEDREFRRRFRLEVQAARRVHGLYTAPVVDSDADGPQPWLATAYVQGPTLAAAVAEHGALPLPTVLLLVAGIAEALQAVHGAGLVHRDLKPSNVLLAADGPRVIDFGIARAADATSLTDTGVRVGTPAFMAPEQAAGREITGATDVFALGQVAAYAALGAPAYGEGPSHAVLYRIVHEEPDLSRLPARLGPLVGRCLAKDPQRRPSLAEVVALCQEAADGTLVRPEQWLPGALAAQIPLRHALPAPPPTAPASAPATRPDAQPYAHQPTELAQPAPAAAPPPPSARPTHAARPAAPGPYGGGYPGGPAPYPGGYPAQGGFPPQGGYPGGAPQPYGQPYPVRPPKKSKAPYVLAAVVAVVALAVVVPLAVNAGGGSGSGTDASKGGGSPHTTSSTGGTSAGGTVTHAATAPKPEQHPGVQLADGYHLEFADPELQPKDNNFDDFYYSCANIGGCTFGAYTTHLVLLDPSEKGSLDTCRKDTRFTDVVQQPRLSPGSQICARTTTGIVALLTYKGASPDSSASRYATFDVTLWRNALPAQ
jgi:tRNA A-37 threonylcarbamoyl transferase component Bud32